MGSRSRTDTADIAGPLEGAAPQAPRERGCSRRSFVAWLGGAALAAGTGVALASSGRLGGAPALAWAADGFADNPDSADTSAWDTSSGTSDDRAPATTRVAFDDATPLSSSAVAPGDAIVDSAGNSFTMPVAAERIICLNNNVYDMICAFGKATSVIGVNDTTTPDPSTPDVPSFGDLSKPNVEAIIEERPDLVIAYSSRLDEGVASQIEGAGIPIARLDLYKPAPCRAELEFLGNVLGTSQIADVFVAQMEALQAYVAHQVEGVEPLRTYWEIYADYKSVGKDSGGDQIMAMAGVTNLAGAETAGHPKVSDEWVISANPQLIVRESSALKGATGPGVTDTGTVEALYNSLVSRPGWDSIDAVRTGRIIVLDTAITTNPLGFTLAPLYIACEAYPERFAGDDPDELLAEMLDAYWPGQGRAGLYAYVR